MAKSDQAYERELVELLQGGNVSKQVAELVLQLAGVQASLELGDCRLSENESAALGGICIVLGETLQAYHEARFGNEAQEKN